MGFVEVFLSENIVYIWFLSQIKKTNCAVLTDFGHIFVASEYKMTGVRCQRTLELVLILGLCIGKNIHNKNYVDDFALFRDPRL